MAESVFVDGVEIHRARSGTWVCVPGPYTALHFRQVGDRWFGQYAHSLEFQWREATLEACASKAIAHYREERAAYRRKIHLALEGTPWE
jgi:hypothetical protein